VPGVPQDYQEAAPSGSAWPRSRAIGRPKYQPGVMYAKGRGGLEDYDLAHM